jgi:putative membrane protein
MVMNFAAIEDWKAVGHAVATSDLVVRIGSIAAAAVFTFLVLVAWTRRGRYRAVGVLTEADRTRVRAAIASAERASRGEVAVVVVERSDDHPNADWLAALTAMLIGSTATADLFGETHPTILLLLHVGFGALGFGLARGLVDFKRNFVTTRRADEMAGEQALLEFGRLELQRTSERTGVLIFVSLFERSVVVLGDQAIHAKVGTDGWLAVDGAVLAGIRERSLADGLVAGVAALQPILVEHFPPAGDRPNELVDHLIVRER